MDIVRTPDQRSENLPDYPFASHQAARYQFLHDFRAAPVNSLDTRIGVGPGNLVFLHIAVATEQL